MILVGDPSGIAKGTIAEETCFDALKRMGLPAFPAPTNDIDPRLRAVEALLGKQVNGGPALVINAQGLPVAGARDARRLPLQEAQGRRACARSRRSSTRRASPTSPTACSTSALVVHGGLVHEFARRLTPRSASGRTGQRITAAGWT